MAGEREAWVMAESIASSVASGPVSNDLEEVVFETIVCYCSNTSSTFDDFTVVTYCR